MAEELGVASISGFCFSASSSLLSFSVSSDQLVSTEVSVGNVCLCAHLMPMEFEIKSTITFDKKVLFTGNVVIYLVKI